MPVIVVSLRHDASGLQQNVGQIRDDLGIPRIGMVSNAMLSWRDAVGAESRGATIGLGTLVILLLLDDTGIARRVSPENSFSE
ncbi:hypothetical protein ACM41_11855 [Bradyrhizobium sp. CCBAU 21362]|nr:hypothetical protein [Bradyrhizobium sp. CCBAU 21362]